MSRRQNKVKSRKREQRESYGANKKQRKPVERGSYLESVRRKLERREDL